VRPLDPGHLAPGDIPTGLGGMVCAIDLLEAAFGQCPSGWQVAGSADTVLVGDLRSGSGGAQTATTLEGVGRSAS
jgi:hypothetical protein